MGRCADRDVNGTFSFSECLHLIRRFMDRREAQALERANEAANEAGLAPEDVDGLHKVYTSLLEEEAEHGGDFNYYTLIKAMQLFGATLTMEQNALLERIFRQHAKPSRLRGSRRRKDLMGMQTLQLPFPQFLTVVGELWRQDFAGIYSSSDHGLPAEDRHYEHGV